MSEDPPPRPTFPKSVRLLRKADFDEVFAWKLSAADGNLVVYGKPNALGHARLGLVVSRKVGNAVRRNRWKRVLREAFRLSRAELPRLDFVVLPRSRETPALDPIGASLRQLAWRLANKAAKRDEHEGPRSP